MAVIDITTENFDAVIQGNSLVVVDFWAKWCGPCMAFAAVFEEVSLEHPDVVFAKVNIEEEQQLAEDFNIRSIPMLMIFRGEFAVFAESGVQTGASLTELVSQAKQLDIEVLRAQVSKDEP